MLIGLGLAMAMNANKCIINNKGAIMGDRFVIVIEADNMRAHAAYLKGMADLDLIWPQLMAHAKIGDDKIAEKEKADALVVKKQHEEFQERQIKYEEEMAEYKAWEERQANSWFANETAPRYPRMPSMIDMGMFWSGRSVLVKYVGQCADRYKSIRNELKHMADLAGAALGPYRMTEYKVKEMIAWEDGSRIEQLKREAAGESMLEIY